MPLPDHDPLKPVNGPDWAWLTDTDNMSAAPTPAALIARPNNLEPNNFISNFPIQMTFLCKPGVPQIARELAWIFVVFLDPCKADVQFDSYRHLAIWNMTLRPWVTTLAVIGTFATCQLYRAMSAFKGNSEDICSCRVLLSLTRMYGPAGRALQVVSPSWR